MPLSTAEFDADAGRFDRPEESASSDLATATVEAEQIWGLRLARLSYQGALDRLSLQSDDIDDFTRFIPSALRYAQIYRYMDKKELAKKYYDEARSILEAGIQQYPEDARFHGSLGIAYAGLGRKEDAITEENLAIKLVNNHAVIYPYRIEELARIYVMVGEFDAAIDQLKHLLSIPGPFSTSLLQLDPAWAPLRNHPRFKKLIKSDK